VFHDPDLARLETEAGAANQPTRSPADPRRRGAIDRGCRDNAQQAETIALNRYRSGLVRTALLANERAATQIGGERMVAAVVLIKALGGGWLGVPASSAVAQGTSK
jgi:hypothetical protein